MLALNQAHTSYSPNNRHDLPYLWVSNIFDSPARELQRYFAEVFDPIKQPQEVPTGIHVMLLDPQTEDFRSSEPTIKSIGYRLLEAGCDVEIRQLHQPLSHIISDAFTAKEFMMGLSDTLKTFEDWMDGLNSPLSMNEAAVLAKLALQHPEGVRCNLELERIRKRADMSSFDWNQFIKKLERDIHKAIDAKEAQTKRERLKLELSSYSRITDPFEQLDERKRIQKTYGLSPEDFKQLLKAQQSAERTSAQKPRLLTFKETLEIESKSLDWLIPTYVPRKTSTIITGLPGVGKTIFATDMAYAIATGSEFLNEKCQQGKVLLINSDQPLAVTKTYLRDRGFDEGEDNIRIVGPGEATAAWTIKELLLLEEWMDEYQPDVVIIDSIRRAVTHPLGIEEKSDTVGVWMAEVERIVCKRAALVWIHHENKDEQKSGVERSSGNTDIIAQPSAHFRIERTNKTNPADPKRRLSMPKVRAFAPVTVDMSFNPELCSFDFIGFVGASEEDIKESESIGKQILELLEGRPGVGYEGRELKELFGFNFYKPLSRMVAQGIIDKRKSELNPRGMVYYVTATPDTQVEADKLTFSNGDLVRGQAPSGEFVEGRVDGVGEAVGIAILTDGQPPNRVLVKKESIVKLA